ncbi:hypothetical protein ACWGKK_36540 [Streptomyces chartreusis]
MPDDESFDELMAQSSLGSEAARSLREQTSPEAARLVLRMVELRDLLDSASPETDPLTLVPVRDELAGAMQELEETRAGKAPQHAKVALNLVRAGHLDRALEYMGKAKKLFDEADDWAGSAQILAMVCVMLMRAGKNARALGTLHEMSMLLASRPESSARLGALADRLRQDVGRPRRRKPGPQSREGAGVGERDAPHGTGRSGRLLLAVDTQAHVGAAQSAQHHVQADVRRLVDEAGSAAGLDPARWTTQDHGDGLLAVLPEGAPEAILVGDFLRRLASDLRYFNHGRVPEARLRLRAAVHVGAVMTGPDGVVGRGGVTVARLVNSAALRTALEEAQDACLAVAVSVAAFRDVVREGHTTIPPTEFRRVRVQGEEYTGMAWVWVPGTDTRRVRPARRGENAR